MADVLSFALITCNENEEFEVVIEYAADFMAMCLGGDDSRFERYVQRAPSYVWLNKETGKPVSIAKDLEIAVLLESMLVSEKQYDDLLKRQQLKSLPNRV